MAWSAGSVTRRSLLAAGAGMATAAGVGSLAGCNGSRGQSSNNASSNTAVTLPSYIPYAGAEPDLASTEDGVEAGFYTYPADRPVSVPDKPGTGSQKLTGMANVYVPVPAGPDKNTWWAGLNDRLGVDMNMIMVPNADYANKFATTIAGNDLPDMMQMLVVANFPQLLESRFTPLDEHLSGNAIKEYPNLANVPAFTWKNAVYNGHIYGIPIPRGRVGSYDFIRPDIFADLGVSPEVTGGWDGFLETVKALSDPKSRRWAFCISTHALSMVQRINECANGWAEEGGQLTSVYETDQYKQSVQDMVTLWQANVLHPDSFNTQQPFKQLFSSGNAVIDQDGYLAWAGFVSSNKENPDFKQGTMTLTTRDGSKPAPWFPGTGYYSINSITKTDDVEKVRFALRVCNYLAAPFGTQEQFYLTYGEEGVNHDLVDGEPLLNDKGIADIALPVGYMGASPHVLYQPGRPQDVDAQHAYMSTVLPRSVVNPTLGLFSNTSATKSAPATLALTDAVNAIIQGRKPFTDLDGAVQTWKKAAGDAMRDEFTEQLQVQGGPSSSPS